MLWVRKLPSFPCYGNQKGEDLHLGCFKANEGLLSISMFISKVDENGIVHLNLHVFLTSAGAFKVWCEPIWPSYPEAADPVWQWATESHGHRITKAHTFLARRGHLLLWLTQTRGRQVVNPHILTFGKFFKDVLLRSCVYWTCPVFLYLVMTR